MDTGEQLKQRFAAALTFPKADKPTHAVGNVTCPGHLLYDLYRAERTGQGWEEYKWESLVDSQRMVWIRLAAAINFPVP